MRHAQRGLPQAERAVLVAVEFTGERRRLTAAARLARNAAAVSSGTALEPKGEPLSGEPKRVVDLDFRVRDCENLFVCDASIFPRGIRVNPQWTIMSLASEAAERIARMT